MTTKLGLKENWIQFSVLLLINAFVGGMVGLERSILPELAESAFAITASSVIVPFIIIFGTVKALTNYFTGYMANRIGRKNLLIIGWIIGLPVPFILMYANSWNWILFANVLLGINQGLTWSSTVVMKIDLVGPRQRGLAMGLNESFGYLAVAIVAYTTAAIADAYGVRPYPFYQGICFAGLGLLLSAFVVRDTRAHVQVESSKVNLVPQKHVFWDTTWRDRNLGAITQAGFVNNLNDGMVWGILPMILAVKGFDLEAIGYIVAVYPAVWGLGQLVTGKVSDHINKKSMLFSGMLLQAMALIGIFFSETSLSYILFSICLGLGTAIVYPTFLAALSNFTTPNQRAYSIGVFRLWRDLGYAFGALLTLLLGAIMSLDYSIVMVGVLTLASACIILFRMR